ncbi:hypothetical protein [Levilactobacillus acidifarinae]|nr:hypothetical protein [Levilactobacillus acidifarinae]GEO70020.1 hypothetical protein LAC03_19300 [Levilactobacillus acidifarinae]
MGNFAWLLPVSLTVTVLFGVAVGVLAVCWWLIFKRTVRHFNTEGK